ncbi:MAG: hypothetical protein DPW19_00370 [cyanobacterium CYA1]|nr:hypothetical protein [cyanobacterium CYA1]
MSFGAFLSHGGDAHDGAQGRLRLARLVAGFDDVAGWAAVPTHELGGRAVGQEHATGDDERA